MNGEPHGVRKDGRPRGRRPSKGLPREPRIRFESSDLNELLEGLQALGRDSLASAENVLRKRPVESLFVAFFVGTFLGALWRRR